MSDEASPWSSFSPAFSIISSLAASRVTELGCAPVGEDPKTFVDRGGLRRLEAEAADEAIRRIREAAYPLIFKLFGSEMPHGKERKLVLAGWVKTWLVSKRPSDIDARPRRTVCAGRQAAVCVRAQSSDAQRPRPEASELCRTAQRDSSITARNRACGCSPCCRITQSLDRVSSTVARPAA
jgi:hypothetical protein